MANSIFGKKESFAGGAGGALSGFMTMDERNFESCIEKMGLSMSTADLGECVEFFRDTEQRDPTAAEIRMIDICRSGASGSRVFETVIDSVTCSDAMTERAYVEYLAARKFIGRNMPVTLKDISEMAARYLKGGLLPGDAGKDGTMLGIDAEVDGEKEPWLLQIGCGDEALSGRAYPHAVIRLAAEERPSADAGKTKGSAACTGLADRIYHPGYAGCRIDADFVFAAAPAVNIRDEEPQAGDIVILLGGDGENRSAEEHRIQNFLRSATVSRMIKRCAVIGEAGIGAAVCGLASGLEIDLDPVLDKDGGMLCVIPPDYVRMFEDRADDDGLSFMRAAAVTDGGRLVMQLSGEIIVDLPTEFLASPGAALHTDITTAMPGDWQSTSMYEDIRDFPDSMQGVAREINICSRRGLTESYDTSAGAGSVLMPFGGRNQLTPAQAMVCRLPLERGGSEDCTMASWAFNPFIAKASPYHAGYLAVVESAAKLVASGASPDDIFFSLQGSYASPGKDPEKWGRVLSSVLGAFEAQIGLRRGAVCMKENWIDSAEAGSLPPTLISCAAAMAKAGDAVSPEFKDAGHRVVILRPETDTDPRSASRGLPEPSSLIKIWETAHELLKSGDAVSAYAPGLGGIAEAVMKMSFGNGIGFRFDMEPFGDIGTAMNEIFGYSYGSIILELGDEGEDTADLTDGTVSMTSLGSTTVRQRISLGEESVEIGDLLVTYEGRLESVFPVKAAGSPGRIGNIDYRARSWHAPIFKRTEPRVLVPVFEGTGCETEAARAIREAGAVPGVMIIKDRTLDDIERSVERFAGALKDAQMVFIPGSIAGYADKAGSMTRFFQSDAIKEGVMNFLGKHDGLICGTGSGFGTLLELGLVPYGRYAEEDEEKPQLTGNLIGCHRSAIVRVRVASNKSPWLRNRTTGEVLLLPVSCSAGRFEASPGLMSHLAGAGQIATQYADLDGRASSDIRFDPCGSLLAVEGASSPDGRVFGRTGLAERSGSGLYRNVEGKYWGNMFESAVQYFK